jgi:ring-1,2-phenylacetyl-CoA epoxidase subunit PaaC
MTKKEWPLWESSSAASTAWPPPCRQPARARRRDGDQERARRLYPPQRGRLDLGGRGRHITASSPSDKGPLYEPSESKVYRHPTFFDIPDDVGAHVMDRTRRSSSSCCRLGDNTLILGHRVSEWCGHAPVLEEDIALANTALDLIGQTQLWLGLAGEVEGKGRSADDLAYLRDAWDFRNLLIAERPNRDFGHTMMRQFLYDAWAHADAGAAHRQSSDDAHRRDRRQGGEGDRLSPRTLLRYRDRPRRRHAESHARMQDALDRLWPYTGEMFIADEVDAALVRGASRPIPRACAQPGAKRSTG